MTSGLPAYDFFAPPRIVFGWGACCAEIGTLARSLGTRAVLIWGSQHLQENGAAADIRGYLNAAGRNAAF